jgi:hypothetical protein
MKRIGRLSIISVSICIILFSIQGSALTDIEPNDSVAEAEKAGEKVLRGRVGGEDYVDFYDLQGDKIDKERWDDVEISVTLGYSEEEVYLEVVSVNHQQMPDQVVNLYIHTPGDTKMTRVRNESIPDQFYLMVSGYGNYSIKIDYKNTQERVEEEKGKNNCGLWFTVMIIVPVMMLLVSVVSKKRRNRNDP